MSKTSAAPASARLIAGLVLLLFVCALSPPPALRLPAASWQPPGRPPAVLSLGPTASLSLPVVGARLPWVAELEKDSGSPALRGAGLEENAERDTVARLLGVTPEARPTVSTAVSLDSLVSPAAGLEELEVGAAVEWPGAYGPLGQVQAITQGGQVVGRVVIPDLARLKLVSAWNLEIHDKTTFPRWQQPPIRDDEGVNRLQRAGQRFEQWRTQMKQPPAGLPGARLVYLSNSLQSNFNHPWGFLIVDGQVIRQRYAEDDYPLDEAFWALVLESEEPGPPRLTALRFAGNRLEEELVDVTIVEGRPVSAGARPAVVRHAVVGAPPLILHEVDVSGQIRSNWLPDGSRQELQPNEVTWDPKKTEAAFSAVGIRDGRLALVTMTAQMTVGRFTQLVRRLRFKDAGLMGGSGDVQQWMAGVEPPLLMAEAREGSMRPGVGRPLNAVLAGYELPAAGLEESDAPQGEPIGQRSEAEKLRAWETLHDEASRAILKVRGDTQKVYSPSGFSTIISLMREMIARGELSPGKKFADPLGGDGRVGHAANMITGADATIIELDPELVRTIRSLGVQLGAMGVVDLTKVHCVESKFQDVDLRPFDVVYAVPPLEGGEWGFTPMSFLSNMRVGALLLIPAGIHDVGWEYKGVEREFFGYGFEAYRRRPYDLRIVDLTDAVRVGELLKSYPELADQLPEAHVVLLLPPVYASQVVRSDLERWLHDAGLDGRIKVQRLDEAPVAGLVVVRDRQELRGALRHGEDRVTVVELGSATIRTFEDFVQQVLQAFQHSATGPILRVIPLHDGRIAVFA